MALLCLSGIEIKWNGDGPLQYQSSPLKVNSTWRILGDGDAPIPSTRYRPRTSTCYRPRASTLIGRELALLIARELAILIARELALLIAGK